jgi:hypothetical protein
LTSQTRADPNFEARHGARFDQLSFLPAAAVCHFAIFVPHHAQAAALAVRPLALKHIAVHPRVRAQTDVLAGDEIALVAIAAGIHQLATSVHLSVAPLAAEQFGAVSAIPRALSVRQEIRVEIADEVAAVGHEQCDLLL